MAATDSRPRNQETRGESEPGGLAGCVVAKSPFGKPIEFSVLDISFELAIPRRPVVFQKPGSELRELVGREHLDVLLDLLNFAHGLVAASLAPRGHRPPPVVLLANARGERRAKRVRSSALFGTDPCGLTALRYGQRSEQLGDQATQIGKAI